jgi:hypothetical protein
MVMMQIEFRGWVCVEAVLQSRTAHDEMDIIEFENGTLIFERAFLKV